MRKLPDLLKIIRGLWCVMHKSDDVMESYYFETKGRAMNKLKKLNKEEKQPFLFKYMSTMNNFYNIIIVFKICSCNRTRNLIGGYIRKFTNTS